MKMQKINDVTFNEIMMRIQSVTNTKTQVELAKFLGIRQSSISDAKKRRAIPAEWLIKLLKHKSTNPDWILLGVEPIFLGPAIGESTAQIIYRTEIKPPNECSAQELITELVSRALIDL
ncbi:helix-turn-helix domain-containing protein [Desulfovibrio intestinalis]|uniref:Bacteriophage CI repressor N-terminal domain-containing protein n=1 Tax=Desulfovibrio intestinalis TaxID=58621 RepID=A0A7W8C0H8_9BACT|nr:helix-turn-helix domain-containing protein [Desulfovibrio intestinalis]MBB5143041.1 hypothetical protein [Desulfovibrio intestinalis]